MRVSIVKEFCTGAGNCAKVCPRVFKVNSGVAEVIMDPVPPMEESRAREAVYACPEQAIKFLIGTGKGSHFPPTSFK